MAKKPHHRHHHHKYSHTLPSSPTHSSSSSDFEFTISAVSPRKSTGGLCPADELFYKGQLLPLQLSPRISMVRNLLLASSSTSSSSDTTTTASRHSTASSSTSSGADCDSSRPSSAAEEDEFKRIFLTAGVPSRAAAAGRSSLKKRFSRFSSVFRSKAPPPPPISAAAPPPSPVKRMSATAREVIRKYMKKVKPLYEKLSQKKDPQNDAVAIKHPDASCTTSFLLQPDHRGKGLEVGGGGGGGSGLISHSFSGNLRYPRKGRSYVSSCPSSMRSSPSHSGVLYSNRPSGSDTVTPPSGGGALRSHGSSDASSMEELQSAIQGAIAHCKNSMMNKSLVISNEIQGGLI